MGGGRPAPPERQFPGKILPRQVGTSPPMVPPPARPVGGRRQERTSALPLRARERRWRKAAEGETRAGEEGRRGETARLALFRSGGTEGGNVCVRAVSSCERPQNTAKRGAASSGKGPALCREGSGMGGKRQGQAQGGSAVKKDGPQLRSCVAGLLGRGNVEQVPMFCRNVVCIGVTFSGTPFCVSLSFAG